MVVVLLNEDAIRSESSLPIDSFDCPMCTWPTVRLYWRTGLRGEGYPTYRSTLVHPIDWRSSFQRNHQFIDLLLSRSQSTELFDQRLVLLPYSLSHGSLIILVDEVTQKYQCFSADSLVTLTDGRQKTIADLRSGDRLVVYNHDNQQLIATSLITMMDYQPHTFGTLPSSSPSLLHISRCRF